MAIDEWQGFKAAVWLGWQIDSNWTDIFLFSLYTIIRPVFGMLTFAFMYLAATAAGPIDPEKLAYILVGSSLFTYAGNAIWNSFFAVHEDKEHYMTIRYLNIAPSNFTLYYLGRITPSVLFSSTISLIINLAVGVFLLGMKVDPTSQTTAYLLVSIPIVALGIIGYALMVVGVSFFTTRYLWSLVDGLTGLSFLLGGVLYPPTVLPPAIKWISQIVPWYYWIEMLRSPIIGSGAGLTLSFILLGAAFSAAFLGLGIWFFNWSVNRAKRDGTLDMVISW